MGKVPSSSKSRRQHPQYNPDNESSAQLGAASSEHFQSLPLAKWDTLTSDDDDKSIPLAAPVPKIPKSKKSTSSTIISCGCNSKSSRREKSSVGRASIETVCGSPASTAGKGGGKKHKIVMTGTDDGKAEMHKGDVGGETWGTVNEPFCDRELAGIGGWIWDVGHKGGK